MERIIDIYGSSANFDDVYRTEDSWYGRVLLDDNNKFEGVVEDYYETDCFFVFGCLTDKSIELTKCSKKDTNLPRRFTADKEGRKYYGDLSVTTRYTQIPIGECQMSYLPAEVTREETDYEKASIKRHINIIKSELGKSGSELLEDFTNSKTNSPKKKTKRI